MKLSIGIVGLPNVGKSTLFKILTNQEVNIANYPFATIDPNVGIVQVPDERLEKLAAISCSKKVIPAVVEFYDIAGLVKGAYKGEGLGNKFLSHIREVSAIVEVVRCFQSDEIIHVEAKINPLADIDTINTELIFKDLDTAAKRLASLEKEAKTSKEKLKDLAILKKISIELNKNILIVNMEKELAESEVVKELSFLTAKPQIYLFNGKEGDVGDELKNKIKSLGADYLIVDLSVTEDINALIKKSYEILGLISFLTTGEDETRAWTIQQGTKAPQASGVIHTDFEKKFIKLEAISWQELVSAGSWPAAKIKGKIRLEGKDYIVRDGDVVIVKHG